MNWTLDQIVHATGGRLLYGPVDLEFSGVGIDSRTIVPGQVFVAIKGDTHDGHGFLPQVVDKGVRGIVVQETSSIARTDEQWATRGVACVAVDSTVRALGALASYQRNTRRIPVVAITGSNGKTSTRQMTALVMAQQFNTLATKGNLNNEIGLPLTLFGLEEDHEAAVLELGMNHSGEIDRLGRIARPTIGVITNVGPAHLEFLGNLEGVARAKSELLPHLDPDGWAVLNGDDANVAAMAAKAPCRVLFFGTGAKAQVRAEAVEASPNDVMFDLVLPEQRTAVHLKVPGSFMVMNALAAAAVGYVAGVEATGIKSGLEQFEPIGGRLNVVLTANAVTIIDDTYNANPSSMAAAIGTLQASAGQGRKLLALGDMLELGEQAERLHARVGMLAARCGAVKLFAHGPMAESLLSGARDAGMAPGDLFAGSKEEIAAHLIECLEPGDWLLVKGSRGMAMESVVSAIRNWGDGSAP